MFSNKSTTFNQKLLKLPGYLFECKVSLRKILFEPYSRTLLILNRIGILNQRELQYQPNRQPHLTHGETDLTFSFLLLISETIFRKIIFPKNTRFFLKFSKDFLLSKRSSWLTKIRITIQEAKRFD